MPVVTVMHAVRLLREGGSGYLMTVVDDRKVVKRIEDIPVVWDFSDVFPDELPGLPLIQEVEFCIDTDPYAHPVSKAPYRMAPVDMKDLKLQLEELLAKGFIQPSTSP